MSRPDYSALDSEMLRLIGYGFNNFTCLYSTPSVRAKATPFTSERSGVDRVVDRRLQALRRAGKIRYHRQLARWEVCG